MSNPAVTLYAHGTGPNPFKIAMLLTELDVEYMVVMMVRSFVYVLGSPDWGGGGGEGRWRREKRRGGEIFCLREERRGVEEERAMQEVRGARGVRSYMGCKGWCVEPALIEYFLE